MKSLAERTEQATAPRGEVPSPCISVCRMRASDGLCEGCWRRLDEIARWAQMDDAEKHSVWMQLAQRAQRTPA